MPEALRKLYRLLLITDFMISKQNEYQTLFFLRFDDSFSALAKNYLSSNKQSIKLNMLANGINLLKFHVSQVNLERNMDLFTIAHKLNQQILNKSNSNSKELPNIS